METRVEGMARTGVAGVCVAAAVHEIRRRVGGNDVDDRDSGRCQGRSQRSVQDERPGQGPRQAEIGATGLIRYLERHQTLTRQAAEPGPGQRRVHSSPDDPVAGSLAAGLGGPACTKCFGSKLER